MQCEAALSMRHFPVLSNSAVLRLSRLPCTPCPGGPRNTIAKPHAIVVSSHAVGVMAAVCDLCVQTYVLCVAAQGRLRPSQLQALLVATPWPLHRE